MDDIPTWRMSGDWFDACSCSVPCPCAFAQPPTGNRCEGIMAYRISEGMYGEVEVSGLAVVVAVTFEGNAWQKENPVTIGIFLDERADEAQREALQMVFSGKAGGWMEIFSELVGEVRGLEFAPVKIDVAHDLAEWRVEIPGKLEARCEALSGPTTPAGARVQLHNAPGSEVGPGAIMTWGKTLVDHFSAFGLSWTRSEKSSKHMRFEWSGPGRA